MEQNLNESPTGTPLTMKMIYELDLGKEFCKQLDKKYLTGSQSKKTFKIMFVIRKAIFKILHLKHD